jgi:hypothetical protein
MLEAKKNEQNKIWPLKYSFVALNLVLYCTFSVSISAVSFVQLSGGGNKDIVLPISSHTHLKVIKFVSDLRQVGGFLEYSGFLHQ